MSAQALLFDPENISLLVYRAHGAAVAGGWWHHPVTKEPLNRDRGEMLMLVISEFSEGMEGVRKDLMDDKLPHRKMFEVELADALIRIADMVGRFAGPAHIDFVERVALFASIPCRRFEKPAAAIRYCLQPVAGVLEAFDIDLIDALAESWVRTVRLGEEQGFDLIGAINEKLEFNRHRADHKAEVRAMAGGKAF